MIASLLALARLVAAGNTEPEVLADKARKLLMAINEEEQMHAEDITDARAMYVTDDIEIDDHPLVSAGDGGVWVSAWVWVAEP